MAFKSLIGATFTCLAVVSFSADANLLTNGSFETGDFTGWNLLSNDPGLQQEIVSSPALFTPPLSGLSYKIRSGNQAIDAGLSQSVSTNSGFLYNWSIDIAAREVQSSGFALGTFELFLDNTLVASQSLSGSGSFSTTFSGVYTATDSAVDFQLIFNRPWNSFTAHPQWFADNAVFELSAVPVPAAVWLFGSGLLGLVGVARRKRS